jgi:glycopeptide antibiotics resistance protein
LKGLPSTFAGWVALHDEWSNVLAFLILTFLGLLANAESPRFVDRPAVRVTGAVLLVLLIEVLQLWIPGRVFDPRDIAAGWAGVLGGWLLARFFLKNEWRTGSGGSTPGKVYNS